LLEVEDFFLDASAEPAVSDQPSGRWWRRARLGLWLSSPGLAVV